MNLNFNYFFIVFIALFGCSPQQQTTNQSPQKTPVTQAKILPIKPQNNKGDYGISIHGNLKYAKNFTHFDYVNPNAPKGGSLNLATSGAFDSLNQFIIRGMPAAGLERIYDKLLVGSADEPYSKYGLIAEKIIQKPQSVEFHLRKSAQFSDGKPVTAEDVKFTFNILTTKGNPLYKSYYADVKKVIILNPHKIKFEFKKPNNELAFILGELPILPKHYWLNKDFQATSLKIPIGSGAYIISKMDAGKYITYKKNPNYWAKNLPVNIGRNNFNKITTHYYFSDSVLVEAVRGGRIDFRAENSAKVWNTAYQKTTNLQRLQVHHKNTSGMQGFIFNIRKPIFKERLIRKALLQAFDFEFVNARFMFSEYHRTNSYFDNSILASSGLPSEAELKLLLPYKNMLPAELFTTAYKNPKTTGDGAFRKYKKTALDLFKKAGWEIKDGKLKNTAGKIFEFNILIHSKSMERIVQPFVLNLQKMGIIANINLVEINQYIQRVQKFNFDMIVYSFGQSLSPGNEQKNYWGSAAADKIGSRNVVGIKNKAVDIMLEKIVQAKNLNNLNTAVKALDRILLWNYYVIPHFHNKNYNLVYNQKTIQPPKYFPQYKVDLDSWWSVQKL